MTTQTASIEPRVFVTCLAAYNNGRLHGEWVDVTSEPDDLREAIQRVLRTSPEPGAEEWFYTDWQGIPESIAGEYADIEALSEWACEVERCDLTALPDDALWQYVENEWQPEIEGIADRAYEDYVGAYDTRAEFAQELIEECKGVPETRPIEFRGVTIDVLNFIDWDAVGRDLLLGGDYWSTEPDGGIYVFRNR